MIDVMASDQQTARVIAKRLLAPALMEVILGDSTGGALLPWDPGAHIDVHLPNWLTRQYSLCGEPDDRQHYRIVVRDEQLSRGGSAYIHRFLDINSSLLIGAPRNSLAVTPRERTLYVAGGIGMTALIAMIRRDAAAGLAPMVFYAARSKDELVFAEEVPEGVNVEFFTSADQRVNAEALADRFAVKTVVICGPTGLMEAVASAFEDHGAEVHTELFRAPKRELSQNQEFEIECRRSGLCTTVGPDETLLEVLQRRGAPVAAGCREGTCGSCSVRVLNGSVEHRDFIGAKNDEMFPCVSRSNGDKLLLDL